MNDHNGMTENASTAEAAPDPRRDYDSPADLASDQSLSDAERAELLAQWKDEVDSELTAQAEGMTFAKEDEQAEVALAREAQKVGKAIAELDEPQA